MEENKYNLLSNKNFLTLSQERINLKNNGFTWIRLFLAVVVVFSHGRYIGFGANEFGFSVRDIGSYMTIGRLALFGFFIISGFLITASFDNTKDVFVFFKKRFLRLAPGFWTCLFVTAFCFIPLFYIQTGKGLQDFIKVDLSNSWTYLWSNITTEIKTPNIGKVLDTTFLRMLNGPLWSLIFEVRAYILLGLLGAIGIFKNKFLILIPSIFFWFSYYNAVFTKGYTEWFVAWVGEFNLAVLFSYFFVASAFYVWRDQIPMDWKLFALAVSLVYRGIVTDQFSLYAPLFLTYIILYVAHKIPTPKWLLSLGDMSYGVYIYSWPIQNALLLSGFTKFDWLPYTLVSILLSLLAGYLSYNLVEKKFLLKRPVPNQS
jgi:peptidoglycan/LPS O-acetylase OafA/YrhL